MHSWLRNELKSSEFKDERLKKRFEYIINAINHNYGKSIPQVFDEWSEIKATYRFLSNARVNESEILFSHFINSKQRITENNNPVLILHDTSEFTYSRKKPEKIGYISKNTTLNSIKSQIPIEYKVCGVLMHASLAITTEGLPLGLTSSKFWTRKVFKNSNQLKRHINPTRIPIEEKESIKWLRNLEDSTKDLKVNPNKIIHICDREGDMFEFFSKCTEINNFFIVRSCVDRLANESVITQEINISNKKFNYNIDFQDSKGKKINAKLNVMYKKMTLHPPHGKANKLDDINLTVSSAFEQVNPKGREKIRWTLITNLPVTTKKDAMKVLSWYKQRWKIEEYFKILKSGLRTEESKLRSASAIGNLIAMNCILAWRIFWTTHLNRVTNKLSANICFNEIELNILKKKYPKTKPKYLNDYIILLARLGGYINRKNDSQPGNCVVWKGYLKLRELYEAFILFENCG